MNVFILACFMLNAGHVPAMHVSGTVTDAVTGKVLSGVLVQVDKYEGRYPGFTVSASTDASGNYVVDYTPSRITGASDMPLPENTLFSVYAADGSCMCSGMHAADVPQAAGRWRNGVYLVVYSTGEAVYCERLVVSGACTSWPVIEKTQLARAVAASGLQTDTLLSYSKDGYTTQGFIKQSSSYDVQLYPRTAADDLAGPGNTGPTGPLKMGGGRVLVQDSVVSGYYFVTTLVITGADMGLRNFIVDGGDLMYGVDCQATGLVLEDGEIRNASSSVVTGSGYTLRRVNLHESDADAIKAWNDVLVEKSWIHHIGRNPDAHADGMQMVRGSDVTMKDNNFNLGVDETGYHCSQVIIVQTSDGPVDNILIQGNWINGGGYSIQSRDKDAGYGDPTNVRVIDNTFGINYRYGIRMGVFEEWSGNTWFDGTDCTSGTYE